LIAFSHYPMLDYNEGANSEMKALFGEKSFQAYRVSSEEVGQIFADLGLKVQVGVHMYLNDIGNVTTKKGNTLINIQTPSLAAYASGYKIITVKEYSKIKIETVVLDSMPEFDIFFYWYNKEHEFLTANFPESSWGQNILASQTYLEFTNYHLQELV
jgi:hypothetical protein